jgi:hypothetical protein
VTQELDCLPEGVLLEPGRITVTFEQAQEALEKLLALPWHRQRLRPVRATGAVHRCEPSNNHSRRRATIEADWSGSSNVCVRRLQQGSETAAMMREATASSRLKVRKSAQTCRSPVVTPICPYTSEPSAIGEFESGSPQTDAYMEG